MGSRWIASEHGIGKRPSSAHIQTPRGSLLEARRERESGVPQAPDIALLSLSPQLAGPRSEPVGALLGVGEALLHGLDKPLILSTQLGPGSDRHRGEGTRLVDPSSGVGIDDVTAPPESQRSASARYAQIPVRDTRNRHEAGRDVEPQGWASQRVMRRPELCAGKQGRARSRRQDSGGRRRIADVKSSFDAFHSRVRAPDS